MFYRCSFLFLYLALMSSIKSLPPCQNIQINGYKYSLQKFKSENQINALTNSQFVRISLCTLIKCNNTLANGTVVQTSGYALVKKNQSSCDSYTFNQTGPLLDMYSLIDEKQPDKGLIIKYPPAYTKLVQISKKTDPETQILINYTTIQTWRSQTTMVVRCNSQSSQSQSAVCSKYSSLIYTENTTGTLIKIYKNELQCQIYQSAGCPTLAVNHFWIFLINNAIAFAIVLWITALFLIVLGYIAIRLTILLYGIYTGSFFGVIFVAENYSNFYLQSTGVFIFTVCLAVVMGILFGIFLLTLPKLGYINIGVFVAALFSLLLQNSVLFLTGSLLAFYITFGVTAFLMAIIALMQLRYFIIICTSFTGAFLLIRPLGFYLPGYPNQLISGKNFLISVKTPWQFYLYLASILILTGIGIAIQRCLNKKIIGRNKQSNNQYYLQEDGTVREKLKKIFQFKQIKEMIRAGKKQFVQLKNMITDDINNVKYSEYGQDQENEDDRYIQMEKIEKIQNQRSKEKEKEKSKGKQKQKIQFIAPRSKKQINKKNTQEIAPIDIEDYEDEEESDRKYKKNGTNKKK